MWSKQSCPRTTPPAAKRLCHHRNAKQPQPCHSGSLELHCSWELSLSSPECSLLTSYPPTSLNCRLVSAMLGLEDTSLIRMIVDDISLEYGFLVRERWWCWVRYKDVLMGNKGLQRGYCVVPSAKESVLLYFSLEEESVKEYDGFLLFM